MFEGGIPPAAIALGLAAIWCSGCAALAARSWPIAMRRALKSLSDRVDASEANWESATGKLHARLVEIGALAEELEGLADTIETKRRRVAAADTRARDRQSANAPPEPNGRAQVINDLKARARQLGWPI